MNASANLITAAELAARLHAKQTGPNQWMACCPSHADATPSLSIKDENGQILVHCFAGCTFDEVLRASGFVGGRKCPSPVEPVVAIDELRRQAKQKFPGSASGKKSAPPLDWSKTEARYDYADELGIVLYQKGRWKVPPPKDKDFRIRHREEGRWIPTIGKRAVPYRLHKVVKAPTVFVVEGEKDVHTLEGWGLVATTSYASSTWSEEWSPLFKGKTVIVLPDNDAAGRKYAALVARNLAPYAKRCKTVRLPVAEKGDVTDWKAAGGTAADLEKLVAATPWDRPSICIRAPKRDTVVKACIAALRQRNESAPVLFARGHSIVYVAKDKKGRATIIDAVKPYLFGELERAADFYQETKLGRIDAWPTQALAEAILARPQAEWGFPALDGVVTGPVLRRDWSLVTEPGYDASLSLYYAPQRLALPPIPEKPTEEQCREAVAVIDDVIGEFPWTDPADRANYMALLLTPLVRHVVGCVPIALIDAPKRGNGKTLLAEILTRVHEGKALSPWAAPSGENWEKIVTTILRGGQPITVFDNLDSTLASGVLSQVVTSDEHSDRQFYTQNRMSMRNTTLFVMTGNNIRLAGDIGRRCYRIGLDAKSSRPWERKKFRHPYLKSYALQRRPEILAALLTMTRGWTAAGRPHHSAEELGGGFEVWSRTVGRILAHAGVEGFLTNQEKLYEDADIPEGQWANFLAELHKRYPNGFKVGTLVSDLESEGFDRSFLPDDPELAPKRGTYDSMKIAGLFLRKRSTRFGSRGLFLDKTNKPGAAALWCIRATRSTN